MGFLIKLLVTALGLALAAYLIPGIRFDNYGTLIIAAILMGLVNAILKPIVFLLTLPLTLLTFGLFLLILNAGMFALVATMLPGFVVDGFIPALLGWLIVTVVGALVDRL